MIQKLIEILQLQSDQIKQMLSGNPALPVIVIIVMLLIVVLIFLGYFFLAWLCLKISRKFFHSYEKKHGKKIHIQFAENLIKVVIIVLFIVIPLAGDKISQSILGSAAVITAIVGFAAQDVIKDVLSGFLTSIYKPFDLGDRIELEDGTAGIVESITMRHVVLVLLDTVRLVIPNSKLNSIAVRNYSYDYVPRSVQFSVPVGYNSDIEQAKKVIASAIQESPYSIPGKIDKKGEKTYGPVYFLSLENSAIIMKTTVYYEAGSATEVVRDDVYTRVFEALRKNGIEVPYPHTDVLIRQ